MPGHITKRSKNSWAVVVDMGRDPLTGKRRQVWRSVKGTKKDAEALLLQLQNQKANGVDVLPGRVTVAEYLAKWLETYARPNTAPKTFRRYEQLIRVHIVPVVGGIPLGKLRPLHIQQVYQNVQDKGRSARTALHCHRVLRHALQQAVKWQLLTTNPADAAEAPRPTRYEMRALDASEVRRLLTEADQTPFGTLVHLAVATGLRQGEILGLRWQDVDLDNGIVRVRQTCQWLSKEGFIFRQPKTYRSSRPVALSPDAVERLKQHRVLQVEERLAAGSAYQTNDLVFSNGLGEPIHPSNLRKAWLEIVEQAQLGHLRFHDLRHTHASLLLEQGVHPKIVSERLGHSTVGITLDVYSHVTPSLQAEAASQFDDLLANG